MADVVSMDVASKELANIEELLEIEYLADERPKLIAVIAEGRLFIDDEKVGYTLVKPIRYQNGDQLSTLVFRVPSAFELQELNKGSTMEVTKEGNTIVDMSMTMERTFKAASKLSGVPRQIINQLSRKDFRVLMVLLNFFD